MKKRDLKAKGIRELKTPAKKAGIKTKQFEKKEDTAKTLSSGADKSPKKPIKTAAKATSDKSAVKKVVPKKSAPHKTIAAKTVVKKTIAKKPAVKAPDKKPATGFVSTREKKAPAKAVKKSAPRTSKTTDLKKTASNLLALADTLKTRLRRSQAVVITSKILSSPVTKKPVKKAAPPKKTSPIGTTKKTAVPGEIRQWKVSASAKKKGIAARADILKVEPAETGYGENRVVTMAVTPSRLYTYWEITGDTFSQNKGNLNLRVTDTETGASFYIPVSGRIDEMFISVSPDGLYKIEIGVINEEGEFVRIEESREVYTPVSGSAPLKRGFPLNTSSAGGEVPEGLPEEFFETPESTTSY